MMSKPYIAVLGIAVLDLLAAATSLIVIDQIGVVASVTQFVVYTAMALGLLALRKWARIVAIAITVVELVGLLAAMAFVLFISSRLTTAAAPADAEFVTLLSALIVINAVVIGALFLPKVKVQFR
jgi:amino acid transporter